MKKLMIAAAIVCAAAFAQAAAIDWSSGVVYAPGANGTGYMGDYSQIDPEAGSYSAILYLSDTVSDGKLSGTIREYKSSTMTENEAYEGSIPNGVWADGTHYGQMIITEANSGAQLISEIFLFETGSFAETQSILVGEGGSNIELLSGNDPHSDYGAFGAGWTAAPEPTSGLLLLIGVGALALRRRRA